jgi:hypothetical protein
VLDEQGRMAGSGPLFGPAFDEGVEGAVMVWTDRAATLAPVAAAQRTPVPVEAPGLGRMVLVVEGVPEGATIEAVSEGRVVGRGTSSGGRALVRVHGAAAVDEDDEGEAIDAAEEDVAPVEGLAEGTALELRLADGAALAVTDGTETPVYAEGLVLVVPVSGTVEAGSDELAEAFVLGPVYPNPFNPVASVSFAVREAGHVVLELYDALGRKVAVLYEGTPEASRYQAVRIDGTRLASGVYFVRMTGEHGVRAIQKITLLK